MMEMLIPIAVKSFLFAGATLLLLQLMKKRSASDRSLIAHLGLGAVLLLPVSWLLFPQLEIATRWADAEPVPVSAAPVAGAMPSIGSNPVESAPSFLATVDWGLWAYLLPAILLGGLTLVAVFRLAILKARAHVLVEPSWLTALAKAQRRMDFKNGTALLTSDELRSPISWGLMRPVILLNSEAAEAHDEAEAIIAHELAHVTRLDWAKLLLSRVTVALFWFNPLVWLLAREAHQLREEAADDAVLASDIEDTEYARLLVGIARHECRGMFIGAHGVAPAKNSLARRVRRVLDAASARAPGGWRWTAAVGFFCAGMAVPLAALEFVPTTPIEAANVRHVGGRAATPAQAGPIEMATNSTQVSRTIVRSDDRAPDPMPQVAVNPMPPLPPVPPRPISDRISQAVALKAVGANQAYVVAIRQAAPGARFGQEDFVSMAAIGVTPDYVHSLAAAGYRNLSAEEIIELRAIGVTAEDVRKARQSAGRLPDPDEMVSMKAVGVGPEDLDPDDSR